MFRAIVILNTAAAYRLDRYLPAHWHFWVVRFLLMLFPSYWLAISRRNSPDALRLALQDLGPIFIKFGQLLSTRKDLIDEDMAVYLAQLQDNVPPFDPGLCRRIIEREIGKPVDEAFGRFDREPLASASVAQVHSAQLHDGREVVVKVIRPGIHGKVKSDIALMKAGARVLESLWRDSQYFHPLRVVTDYEEIITNELDLEHEGQNTERMQANFAYSDLLYVPTVHKELSTRNILVLDRINGVPISDRASMEKVGMNMERLAERGLEIFFTQVFKDNFFHADMHPGNVFVSLDDPDEPQYIAIDCAICGELSRKDQLFLAQLALCALQQDYRRIVQMVIDDGWVAGSINREKLERKIAGLLDPVFNQPLDQLDFAPMLVDLLQIAREFHIEAPTQYVLLLKTLIHVEGLGRDIYPGLDVWTIGRPMLEAWMHEQVGVKAIVKEMQQRAPDWWAQLPEMPGLFRDALLQIRRMEQHPEENRRLHEELKRQVRRSFIYSTISVVFLVSAIATALSPYYLPQAGDIPAYTRLFAVIGIISLGALVFHR